MQNKKVLVAMSGGVDSSVAALLLKEEGYSVTGVTLRTWEYPASACNTLERSCCSPEDLRDAEETAYKLGIPHHIVKTEELFRQMVIGDFIREYKSGRTPNPCIECNSHIKFGFLYSMAKKLGMDAIATGHYAGIQFREGRYSVAPAEDKIKNQCYYLYTLSQDNLMHTLFPLEKLVKQEVRELARKYGLPVAEKLDSQEICFIPGNDYREFLKKEGVEFISGRFLHFDGRVLGQHTGKEQFTIGQRKGLGLAHAEPLYVLEIHPNGDVVLGERFLTESKKISLENLVFQGCSNIEEVCLLNPIRVQVRYRQNPVLGRIQLEDGGIYIYPEEPIHSPAPGQSAVVYHSQFGNVLFGGKIGKIW